MITAFKAARSRLYVEDADHDLSMLLRNLFVPSSSFLIFYLRSWLQSFTVGSVPPTFGDGYHTDIQLAIVWRQHRTLYLDPGAVRAECRMDVIGGFCLVAEICEQDRFSRFTIDEPESILEIVERGPSPIR